MANYWAPMMKKQVVNVSVLQSAKVMAVLYFVVSFPMALILAFSSPVTSQGYGLLAMIALPVLYTLFGFIFSIVGAWIYNLVAARVGGFEFTTVEIGERS